MTFFFPKKKFYNIIFEKEVRKRTNVFGKSDLLVFDSVESTEQSQNP